jgi:hypothetical protein
MKLHLFSRRGVLGTIAFVTAVTALPAVPAQAALISTTACDNSALTQPFAPWGDTNPYKLVPGGSFEATAGWSLSHGAKIVSGSEPYGATGSVGKSSLYLPAGSSAQSPLTCVNAAYPTLRFFGHNSSLLSTVVVSVVYPEPLIGSLVLPVGIVALTPGWKPSAPMLTVSAVPGLLSGGTANVAIRFTALLGTSQIDDVFVDPRMHN